MSETSDFIGVAREAVDQLKRLTRDFPKLSSQPVRIAIETWNEDLFSKGELVLLQRAQAKAEKSAMEHRATELIEFNLVDDAIDILNQEFPKGVDYLDLIDMVGKDKYIAALGREAAELKINAISPEQTAELWNSAGKPTVGGERWNATGVAVLMG
ncbi:MAG: hypothetical protein KZQ89_19025 [Candidatus Thiodiazotropha sp. (ex Lucinoma kastoroae)]|nr:hypothetical protein [Candidatus Thiodiazotropha sp. (ex Rostrolucina anterorostrata)]MCU7850039.1 hypothetical protein [Candidatus Thiodiazotropha sp. (ex Lucinoma kastoroae)]MCU7858476.1 hypothetical protein [Candidatus Thiodiazotropha sp. (ex Lucinoma kastoroae)]